LPPGSNDWSCGPNSLRRIFFCTQRNLDLCSHSTPDAWPKSIFLPFVLNIPHGSPLRVRRRAQGPPAPWVLFWRKYCPPNSGWANLEFRVPQESGTSGVGTCPPSRHWFFFTSTGFGKPQAQLEIYHPDGPVMLGGVPSRHGSPFPGQFRGPQGDRGRSLPRPKMVNRVNTVSAGVFLVFFQKPGKTKGALDFSMNTGLGPLPPLAITPGGRR